MLIIPTQAVPAQSLLVSLAGQSCQIDLKQTAFGLFMDFWLNNPSIPTLGSVLCQDRNLIVRNSYFGFAGDLAFVDQQSAADPVYTGLGSRYLLYYLESGGPVAAAGAPALTGTAAAAPEISGVFTLTASATSTTVTVPGVTASSQFKGAPTPVTPHAANDMATTSYVFGLGQIVITHANNARTDRTFTFTIKV